MGFVWEHADSFLHCVASPFHSFVTIIVDVVIAGAPARALVDSGANVSFMSDDFVKSVGIACDTRNAHSAPLADGIRTSVGITGCTPKLSVKLSSVLSKHKFLVLPNLAIN